MPPRRKASAVKKSASPPIKAAKPVLSDRGGKKPAANGKKKRAGPYKMPPPIPKGEILTDLKKNKWCIGTSVGKGGFGEIYTASPSGKSVSQAQFVIKIEPHENGPLFTELSFYTRIAKPERIVDWIKTHSLSYLAVPKFVASGSHEHGGTKFRFMVMERFGEDIEKKFTSAGRKFSLETVCYLAIQLIEALEFLHESEYVHADIKGSNLLTGYEKGCSHEVYLVDYGLAYRYCPDGEHKPYKEDPRKAHDGTIEFTSIDAHKGVNPSRRADVEILGYCLLQWASGRLPWEGHLEDKDKVARMKIKYHGDSAGLLKACFSGESYPSCLKLYMEAVYKLGYQDKPNYCKLKQLFTKELKDLSCHGHVEDKLDWIKTSPSKVDRKRKSTVEAATGSSDEGEESPPPKKKHVKQQSACVADVKDPPTLSKAKKVIPEKKSQKKQKRSCSTDAQERSSSDRTPVEVYYPESLGYTNARSSSSGAEREEVPLPQARKRKRATVRETQTEEEGQEKEETAPKRRREASVRTASKPMRTRSRKKS